MKKILFPFVETQDNKDSFVYAAKIARNMNAELILLNTYTFEVSDDITKKQYSQLTKKKWLSVYNEVQKMKSNYILNYAKVQDSLNIRFDYRFVYGEIIPEIISVLQKEKIDLIIITVSDNKKNNTNYYDDFINKAYNNSSAPILAVPEKHTFTDISNIIFSKSINKLNDPKMVIKNVGKFAESFNAKIHFVKITDNKNDIDKDSEYKILSEKLIKGEHLYNTTYSEDKYLAIKKYTEDNKIDIITVVKRNKSLINRFLTNSFTDKIVLNSENPVLILMDGL